MAVGQYKIRGNPVWVQVQYGAHSMPIFEDDYREKGYKPDFDALPWQDERDSTKDDK